MEARDRRTVVAAAVPFALLAIAAAFAGFSVLLVVAGVALAALLLLAVQLRTYRNLLGRFSDQETRRRQDLLTLYRQIEARLSLASTLGTARPLPATRGWAVSPDAALALGRLVRERRPRRVLELGSGTSTVILGLLLEETGSGSLVSLESDPEVARRTRLALREHGLEEIVEVRTAPLVPLEVEGHSDKWYDRAALEDQSEVDLLVVDGPPGSPGVLVRYPALPVVWPRLAARAAVFVDDTLRPEEREIVERWLGRFEGLQREDLDCEKGAVVLYRSGPDTRA